MIPKFELYQPNENYEPRIQQVPSEKFLSTTSGLNCNHDYCDLRGVTWQQAEQIYELENDVIKKADINSNNHLDYYKVLENELENQDLLFLEGGCNALVAALSAAGCAPVASCNTGGTHGTFADAGPQVTIFCGIDRGQLLKTLLSNNNTVLLVTSGFDNQNATTITAESVAGLIDFARVIIDNKDLFDNLPVMKHEKNPFAVNEYDQNVSFFSTTIGDTELEKCLNACINTNTLFKRLDKGDETFIAYPSGQVDIFVKSVLTDAVHFYFEYNFDDDNWLWPNFEETRKTHENEKLELKEQQEKNDAVIADRLKRTGGLVSAEGDAVEFGDYINVVGDTHIHTFEGKPFEIQNIRRLVDTKVDANDITVQELIGKTFTIALTSPRIEEI